MLSKRNHERSCKSYVAIQLLESAALLFIPHPSAIERKEKKEPDSLPDGIVKELVAPQIALQAADVEAVCIAQAFQSRELHRHPNLIAWVFGLRAVHAFSRSILRTQTRVSARSGWKTRAAASSP